MQTLVKQGLESIEQLVLQLHESIFLCEQWIQLYFGQITSVCILVLVLTMDPVTTVKDVPCTDEPSVN